jgi:CBS domain-containing protein
MQARDIMSTDVFTVRPDTTVRDVAAMLLSRYVSAMPVVDEEGRVLGIVSEGDLIRRAEAGTGRRRSWWLELLAGTDALARDYLKEHGRLVEDIMTSPVVSVTEDTSAAEIAEILDSRRIKRVPVLRNGKVVGIVSRADLIRGMLRAQPSARAAQDDDGIEAELRKAMEAESWAKHLYVNFGVKNGVVTFAGSVGSDNQIRALRRMAEDIPGVREVDSSLLKVGLVESI